MRIEPKVETYLFGRQLYRNPIEAGWREKKALIAHYYNNETLKRAVFISGIHTFALCLARFCAKLCAGNVCAV